jgi:glycosyltransferase involved in cell wall biosynthesis
MPGNKPISSDMVSVCLATKNGSAYLREQIDSILAQLTNEDELIITDDASTDETVSIVNTYNDRRITLLQHHSSVGVTRNFEKGLNVCKGAYIFLADQDDVWSPHKIERMVSELQHCDLAICDCAISDYQLNVNASSFFSDNRSGKGLLKNLYRNSYMGCCMAFRREILARALPFPKDIPIHDFWIGLIAELHFSVNFIPEVLVRHRRHGSNASTTGQTSRFTFMQRIEYRYRIVKALLLQ